MKTFKMGKWKIIILVVSVVTVGVLVSQCGQKAVQTNKDVPAVEDNKNEKQKVNDNEIQLFGQIKVETEYNVNVEFPVKIKKILVETGTIASEGAALVQLEMEQILKEYNDKVGELSDSKKKRDMSLVYEKNVLVEVKNKLARAQEEFEKKDTGEIYQKLVFIKEATSELEVQREKFKAAESLFAQSAISKDEYNSSKLEFEKKQNAVNTLHVEYTTMLKNKEQDIADLKISRLEHEKNISEFENQNFNNLETDIHNLKKQIYDNKYLKGNQLICPVKNGLVEQALSDGSFVEKGDKVLTIYNLDTIYAEASVPEEFYSNLKEGKTVRIIPVADKTKEYKGVISNVSGLAKKVGEQVEIPIKIKIDNKDAYLIPNLNVDIFIEN